MDWKETVTNLSENMFPGISYKMDPKVFKGHEVNSNLPLQIAAYLNVVFSPIWTITLLLFMYDHYSLFTELYKFITITVLVTIFLLEIIRLYLCYEGNLRDKIPELAGFWMLSTFLQLPLHGFLMFNTYFEKALFAIVAESLMLALLVIQVICGYWALRYTATQQSNYFRIVKLRNQAVRESLYRNKENH